jgi:acetyl esterase/lipase
MGLAQNHFWAWGYTIVIFAAGCDDASLTLLRVLGPAAENYPRQVEITNGVEYARPDGKSLRFDLFRPFPRVAPVPLVLNIHGGGWRDGTRDQLVEYSYDFAANGFATAQIDYRLSGDGGVFPAPVADILHAIRYFRANATALEIDPDRIALFGASAGGHLAMLAGLSKDASIYDPTRPAGESSDVKAVISLFGPTDLTVYPPPEQADIRALLESFLGRPLDQAAELRIAASPIHYVRADGPPLLIIHGAADTTVSIDQARRLVDALRLASQPYVYLEIPDMDHLFGGVWQSPFGQRNRNAMLEFLAVNL